MSSDLPPYHIFDPEDFPDFRYRPNPDFIPGTQGIMEATLNTLAPPITAETELAVAQDAIHDLQEIIAANVATMQNLRDELAHVHTQLQEFLDADELDDFCIRGYRA